MATMATNQFRNKAIPGDEKVVREIVTSSGFFYDNEIELAIELVEEKLKEGEQSSYQFIFVERDGQTVAYSCFGHIAGTENSFDLYWIVTHNEFRALGIGKLLLEETQRQAKEQGGRNLIAETSCLEKYEPTRHFYRQMGYTQTGQIPDYYKEGDDKVTFFKKL